MITNTMRSLRGAALVCCLLASMAAACQAAEEPPTGTGNGPCDGVAVFEGHEYERANAVVHPSPGAIIGDARIPGCNDTGAPSPPTDVSIQVARLTGIDPQVAFVDADSPGSIYVRSNLAKTPDEIAPYFSAPACEVKDEPIQMSGPWLGIIGADGETELDLLPPYDLEMLVTDSSSARYLSAELTVRVLPALGSPLTDEDVKTTLWTGGSINVVAACDGERFIAQSVKTFA